MSRKIFSSRHNHRGGRDLGGEGKMRFLPTPRSAGAMVWLRASGACPGLIWGRAGAFFDKCIVDWKLAPAGDAHPTRAITLGRRCPTMSENVRKCPILKNALSPKSSRGLRM